jgi:hypothetical protein
LLKWLRTNYEQPLCCAQYITSRHHYITSSPHLPAAASQAPGGDRGGAASCTRVAGRRDEREQRRRRSETSPASCLRGRRAKQEQRAVRDFAGEPSKSSGGGGQRLRQRAEQEQRRRSQRYRRRAVCEVGERQRRRSQRKPCTGLESRARIAAMVVTRLRRPFERKHRYRRRCRSCGSERDEEKRGLGRDKPAVVSWESTAQGDWKKEVSCPLAPRFVRSAS